MASFTTADGAEIHFDETGEGVPVLAIAPGGMRSARELWARAPFDPRRVLADRCRVVTMDQRNAGESTGPVSADHGWSTFTADQLALLDHLGIDRFVALGMCIGGPYCMGLIEAAPERVAAAVLLQPIGLVAEGPDANREAFHQMYDAWADELAPRRADVAAADWKGLRANLFDGDFLFNVDRDFVRGCRVPLLVARGDDLYHPAATSEEIVELAPQAELIEQWKEGEAVDAGVARIREFIGTHGPG